MCCDVGIPCPIWFELNLLCIGHSPIQEKLCHLYHELRELLADELI